MTIIALFLRTTKLAKEKRKDEYQNKVNSSLVYIYLKLAIREKGNDLFGC